MSYEQLLVFLGWCTLINWGLLVFWGLMLLLAKDFTYRMHKMFFDLTIEEFNLVHYKMMGQFKLFVFMFNFTPYIVLRFFI